MTTHSAPRAHPRPLPPSSPPAWPPPSRSPVPHPPTAAPRRPRLGHRRRRRRRRRPRRGRARQRAAPSRDPRGSAARRDHRQVGRHRRPTGRFRVRQDGRRVPGPGLRRPTPAPPASCYPRERLPDPVRRPGRRVRQLGPAHRPVRRDDDRPSSSAPSRCSRPARITGTLEGASFERIQLMRLNDTVALNGQTDEHGRFSIDGLAPGTYYLRAGGYGTLPWQSAPVTIDADHPGQVAGSLDDGVVLTGTAIDAPTGRRRVVPRSSSRTTRVTGSPACYTDPAGHVPVHRAHARRLPGRRRSTRAGSPSCRARRGSPSPTATSRSSADVAADPQVPPRPCACAAPTAASTASCATPGQRALPEPAP